MFRSVQMDFIMGEVQGHLLKLMFHLYVVKYGVKIGKTWQDYVVLLCSARSVALTEVCALLIRTLIFPNLSCVCFTTLLTKASLSELIYIDLKNENLNTICFLNSSLAFSRFLMLISLTIDCPSLA